MGREHIPEMWRWTCSRCGKVEESTKEWADGWLMLKGFTQTGIHQTHKELCGECRNDFYHWLQPLATDGEDEEVGE